MKKMIIAALMCSAIAHAGSAETVVAPVSHLYVPVGFDSNDIAEVVVTGKFPNPCYSRNEVKVSVADERILIDITAIVSEKSKCPQMAVPFQEVVSLGNLQGGEYQVIVNGGQAKSLTDTLVVAEASSSAVDDHIYAAIDYVDSKDKETFLLQGWNYSSCLQLDHVEVVSNKKDTFSILPVMKQVSDFCPMKGVPVSYPVKLNVKQLKMKNPLLHIRTMDGKSVNKVLNLDV